MGLFHKSSSAVRAWALPRLRPRLEQLESRITPYVNTGNTWPHPQLITISFVPDGTILGAGDSGYLYSNLFATFNKRFGSASKWENIILKAAQSWAQQANINFSLVSDNGTGIGGGPDQQGDPNMGDIRIGGYNFGYSVLAGAELPPPINNYSDAGDIQFNTGMPFNINGSIFDLYTVAAHEIGHALGLGESTVYQATMYQNYTSVKSSLNADDIQGIQSIYGAPPADGTNTSFSTATNITSTIDPVLLTADVNNLDLATTSDVDYYTFTAPAATTGTMTVTVQSKGLSLLTPTLTVYDANQNQLGTVSGLNQYGTTLTFTVSNVTAGEQFYVKVAGADTTAFSTGAYALTLNFGSGPNPVVPLPNTTTPDGNPLSGGGGLPELSGTDSDAPGTDSLPIPDAAPPSAAVAPAAAAAIAPQGQAAQAVASAQTAMAVQTVHVLPAAPLVPVALPTPGPVISPSVIVAMPTTISHLPTPEPGAPASAAAPAARPAVSMPDGGGTADVPTAPAASSSDAPAPAPAAPADAPAAADQGSEEQPAAPAAPPAARPDDAFWMAPVLEPEAALPWRSLEPSAPALDAAATAGLAAAFLWAGQPHDTEERRRRPAGLTA